jgi:monooxygenase
VDVEPRDRRGDLIRDHLHETVAENDLERHIRFGHHVTAARWSTDDARWTVSARRADGEDVEEFAGQVIHPQFWPEDCDYAGKRVVIEAATVAA